MDLHSQLDHVYNSALRHFVTEYKIFTIGSTSKILKSIIFNKGIGGKTWINKRKNILKISISILRISIGLYGALYHICGHNLCIDVYINNCVKQR